jgi:hypothetical protein
MPGGFSDGFSTGFGATAVVVAPTPPSSPASDAVSTFRTHWATRFVDTITFTRLTDRGTFNPATNDYDTPSSTTVYTGGALIRPASDGDTPENYGQTQQTTVLYDVYLPHDAGTFDLEDLGTVDASVSDTELVGQTLRVVSIEHDSYRTRTRLRCLLNLGAGYAD